MSENTNFIYFFNILVFIVLPYLSIFSLLIFSIQRYTNRKFSYSALSSQFLENKHHFWALVPFHYGILTIFFGHLIGFLFPKYLLLWNSVPIRLFILEITGFIGAVFALIGLVNIFVRRITNSKARIVTSKMDWVVLTILLLEISAGLLVAVLHSWGSSWFASSLSPYLMSIVTFKPDMAYVTPMPFWVQFHVIGAWLIFLLFPFTRLIHILVVPNPYLWRRPQVVRWYWDRKLIRKSEYNIKN